MSRQLLWLSLRRGYITTLALLLLIAYFAFHTVYGERGLLTYSRVIKELSDKQQQLEQLRLERLELEHKVNLLRSESLDLDLLDERAREMLGLANPEEEVTFREDSK